MRSENTGAEFEDEDVVRAYRHRTDYPADLYRRLLELASGRTRMLDLGCGPGQFARRLSPHFTQVLAVDPSWAMLQLGRSLPAGPLSNIQWMRAKAEEASLAGPIDLIVAGASIHWMNPAVVFPKLAGALSSAGVMAIVGGDGPADAPWLGAWNATIIEWVGRMGDVWNGAAHRGRVTAHEPWFEEIGRESFCDQATATIENLIEAEHSRATWARSKMGGRAIAFDADLRGVLAPHAIRGEVTFGIQSVLKWGRARPFLEEATR